MISILLLFLALQWKSSIAYQVNEKETVPPKLPLRPGDLLRSLDALTSDAQVIYSPLQETPKNLAERRVYHNEALNDNEETASEYDYDKAYENFVNKYFAKGEKDLNSEDESDEDEKAEDIDDDEAAPFELSSEVQNDSKVKENSSSGSKKCERIQINDQNCRVCEDPKTNEKSKTCSYSSDNKPKSYAFSNEKSRKRTRDGDDKDDDDDVSDETGRSLKRETSSHNKRKFQPRKTSIETFLKPSPSDDSSKCIRKLENDMICFYCGSVTENTRECLADKNNLKKRRHDEFSKKDSATKKIFKRMVSYSFKNDAEPKFKKNTYAAYTGYSI